MMEVHMWSVLVLVWVSNSDSLERGFVYCPAYPCTCESSEGVLIINCRNLYLSSLPMFLSFEGRVQELSLRSNSIKDLPANGFLGLHVEKLDLLDNPVSHIHKDAFVGLEDSLKSLSIQLYAMYGLPTQPLSRLVRLTSLTILGCKQQELHAELFHNLTSLKELHLIGCRISQIQSGAFSPVPRLHTLVLAENALRYQNIPEISQLANLVHLDLSSNDIRILENFTFSRLTKLRNLYLRFNKLSHMAKQALHNLDFSLEELDLCGNQITEKDLSSLENLKVLRRLNLSVNNISQLSGEPFLAMRYMTSLDVAHNRIKTIERKSFKGLGFSLHELDLHDNPLEFVEVGAFSECGVLERLNLNTTKLGGTLRVEIFDGLAASLRNLDVSESSVISSDLHAFSPLTDLNNLDLSYNRITDFDVKLLQDCSKLEYANFSHNVISRFLGKKLPNIASSLKFLDLSWNNIQTIPECLFFVFNELGDARLEGNPLVCSCNLSWLYRWLQMVSPDKNQESHKWKCSSPNSLKDYSFSELEFSDFKCSNSSARADKCLTLDAQFWASVATTKVSMFQKQTTPVCGPICLNITRPNVDSIYVQWTAKDIEKTDVFSVILKRQNDSSNMQTATVSKNNSSHTFTIDDVIEMDICVAAMTKELLPLAQICQTVPSFDNSADSESKKKQLQSLMHNSFLPLMFIYICASISFAFIVACIVVCIRKNHKRPRRIKPLHLAYPGWIDHRVSVASSNMTHDPQFLNSLFTDSTGTQEARNLTTMGPVSTDRGDSNEPNPNTNLPLDLPIVISSRRESGIDNTGRNSTCSALTTSHPLPTEIFIGRADNIDDFFFHF